MSKSLFLIVGFVNELDLCAKNAQETRLRHQMKNTNEKEHGRFTMLKLLSASHLCLQLVDMRRVLDRKTCKKGENMVHDDAADPCSTSEGLE